jgi:polar amino acid transport system substrate-binding protein
LKQLVQVLKTGEMTVEEVPAPTLRPGTVLVQNRYSLISAGTEGATVKTARKSLLGKAKERPQQVKQVLDVLKVQGPTQTYRAVMKKLDAYSPLGYSASGQVIAVGEGISEFAVGDKVACAGVGYANHAEVVCVPKNLCVKLAADANMQDACYNTLGAIALQGVRQADLKLGETCVIIGLGLIGQLTGLMLRASGVKVVGIDLSPDAVAAARRHCADLAFERSESGIVDSIEALTSGVGADAVIITAGSSSLDPINFAGEVCRKKGRVVVVGAVATGFDRDPFYYRKEIELRMSCSYGPGRYDMDYEEKGHDYPAAYVRWTENRNMRAFQELLHSGRINIDHLTTHQFDLAESPAAYDMILNGAEPYFGVIIRYADEEPELDARIPVHAPKSAGNVSIGFIGAGSYAQSHLLPHLPRNAPEFSCKAVMTASGTTSKKVAEKFGFEFCTRNEDDILTSTDINTVFVATRHDSHGDYALKAIKANKHLFVEKPICLRETQLDEIEQAQASSSAHLMIGFNRRFAPLARHVKKAIGQGAMSMLCRINAGAIGSDSWIQDADIGGGRIIGEVCHFVDLQTYFCGSLPVRVFASALPDPEAQNDTVSITIEYENGSVGTILYLANGAPSLGKEYVEVHRAGVSAVLRDFKELEVVASGKTRRTVKLNQHKGQSDMVATFLEAVKVGGEAPIPLQQLLSVSRATFRIVESLRERKLLEV